ncbi:MAG: c-type cytochrome [Verrucomicrobia bacterium]|nr:c-type cytochrome [Verrucomicrobiota bacterium]
MARFALALLSLWLLRPTLLRAHPAHAEEVNYPLVTGFQRFHAADDSPEHLAKGGELLLNELNCVACHAPPEPLRRRFPGAAGPNLAGVASRFGDESVVQLLLRNPRMLKRSTPMPSLFAGPDRDEEELAALYAYLVSLRQKPGEPLLLGNVERGRKLYHETGCIACHAPDGEYVPPGFPAEATPEAPAIPSQPVRIALFWTADHLTRFLLDPLEYHPSGRMPGQGLAEIEAADLAAYLQASPLRQEPDPARLQETADPGLAARGRAWFASKGCGNCHETGDGPMPRRRAKPLLELRPEPHGCLQDEPLAGAVPYYYLSPLQRSALTLALQNLATTETTAGIDEWMTRMDCYACHARQGKGGPEAAREPYFGALGPDAVDRESFLPPALEDVFQRRTDAGLRDLFSGRAARRYPKAGARMIRLPEPMVEEFLRMR